MQKPAQKKQKNLGSTQKFTEIEDIQDSVVFLSGGNACMVIEIHAINFALLSQEEQFAKIAGYANLLNSLSFPIQIVIKNKPVDITHYLQEIQSQIQKARNQGVASYIQKYYSFIQEMIQVNTILDKRFYIVIPHSALETGAKATVNHETFLAQAKANLQSKAESLLTQIVRLSLRARVLEKAELLALFYEIYNQNIDQSTQLEEAAKHPVVRGVKPT